MGQITADQSQAIMAALAVNVKWSEIDFEGLNLQDTVLRDPKRAGEQFTLFLKNKARVIVGNLKSLAIDRTNPFNPTEFIGSGVTIWRGPADGNGLEGVEEQDARSLALTKISLANLSFEHMLKGEERLITGEEKLKRHIAAGHILPDAKIAQVLYEEPGQVTLRQLHQTFGVTWMEFPGTTLRRSGGYRYFLYLDRGGVGRWGWRYSWLDNDRIASNPSVVFASPQVSVSQI